MVYKGYPPEGCATEHRTGYGVTNLLVYLMVVDAKLKKVLHPWLLE